MRGAGPGAGCGGAAPDPPNPLAQLTAAAEYSPAEVDFDSEDCSHSVDVGIFDYAHIPFPYLPFSMILGMKVGTESTEGYERTTKIEGYPGFEKSNRSGTSEAIVMLGERFIVKAEARGMDEVTARKVLEGMDLEELAK